MTMRLRRYRWSDLDAVWELHRTCLAQVGIVAGDGVYYEDDMPRIIEIYLADRGEFLVGEVDGRIMAMGALRRVDDETAEVCRLRVHPDFQRRGFATRMLEALEEAAARLGYTWLRGDTTLAQGAALELYRKFGWQEVRREQQGGLMVVYGEKPVTTRFSSEVLGHH
ncbi:GNAT family N-acetyltransferase [Sphaerisporangium rubeum]|uniref:Ribosomal protein S18 acetylase RimI-like enzyme n=1 Tax=Sphaerisporangium rubeum TaxID=321317 RepID=A0A7X0IJR5_9ACTN|nr:GNAT family N-acetyltransferase [Sphaerisporangium rubeum]MBB6475273.1 ribosomal protein S18 acetylase RimI-like enzyme [Sphaerisporangium rubeum]